MNVGKILERVAPVCDGFGSVPRDYRPLFDPIDYVVFKGLAAHGEVKSTTFLGVKTGGGALTPRQRQIRAGVEAEVELFCLTDLMLAYRAKPAVAWLDRLEADEDHQQRAEDRFAEDEQRIREVAKEGGRQALPDLLREAEPVFACRGYFAHDVKPLFDPVDYIVFDGMNASSAVKRVVLFDGPALGHARERVQRSVQRALEAGNCKWRTVQMGKDGRIQGDRGSEDPR